MITKLVSSISGRYTIVKWLVILCFFDALSTDIGIRMHVVHEANPFAKLLYDQHVILFYSYKVVLPLALLALLPHLKQRAFINRLIIFAAILYIMLALYHVGWMIYALVMLP